MATSTATRGEIITERAAESLLFTVTAETVSPLRDKYLGLAINGIEDKEGAEIVRRARLDCMKARTTCEREHKAAKEDALKECQRIDKSRRDILAMIAPIEKHLEDQEQAVADEKSRIAKQAADAIYKDRLIVLTAAGGSMPEVTIRHLNDDEFAAEVSRAIDATRRRKEEADRLAAIAEQQRIEAEELAKQRAELDRQRAEQQAEAAKLAAAQKAIEDAAAAVERAERERIARIEEQEKAEMLAKQRAEQLEAAKLAAAEKARIETEQRIKREAEAAAAKAAAEDAARIRQESLRPDREKLLAVALAVELIELPIVGPSADACLRAVNLIIAKAADDIRAAIKSMK